MAGHLLRVTRKRKRIDMRHRRKVKYFGVKTAHRKLMFRNMVTSLLRHGRITTTVTRAKELRRLADKMITLAKDGSLHARRQALSVIMDKSVVAKLFNEIAEQMASRRGGYTRIVRIGPRQGDGAMMCVIELVMESLKPARKSRKTKAHEEAAAAPTVIPQASVGMPESPAEKSVPEEPEARAVPGPVEGIQEGEALREEGQESTAAEATGSSETDEPAVPEKQDVHQEEVSAEMDSSTQEATGREAAESGEGAKDEPAEEADRPPVNDK